MSTTREKQERMLSKMREVLQENFLNLDARHYTVTEDLEAGTCRISCTLRAIDGDGEALVVEGEGVGMIDALFNALKTKLAAEYASLQSIQFSQFGIEGLIESSEIAGAGTGAKAEATVGILNSEGKEFVFQATAASTSQAGIQATLAATEYFVNSERTFIKLSEILEHYRSEGRTDLVQKYTSLMTEFVSNTSYSRVVGQIRDRM